MFAIGLNSVEFIRGEIEKQVKEDNKETVSTAQETVATNTAPVLETKSIDIVQKTLDNVKPDMNLIAQIIATKISGIAIDDASVKKRKNAAPPENMRCKKRVMGGKKQCNFHKVEGNEYCSRHLDKDSSASVDEEEDEEEEDGA